MEKQNQRIFHLTDFLRRNIYVQLNSNFGRSFFSMILDNISLNSLAERLGVKTDLLARYVVNYREDLLEPVFIELNVLLKLIDTYNELVGNLDILSDLEMNVRAIRGYGRSGILRNPCLPIREDIHLVRLVLHLIGDGTLTEEYGTTKAPHYTNGNAFLRNQFLNTLGRVFGDVSECSRSYIDRSGKSRSYITFAKWIGYLLRHWYPDAKFDEKFGSLPSVFFQLPLALKAEIVRTFGDDDGHVGAHSIRFTSGGATILEQIRKLIMELIESTLSSEECKSLLKSVGDVKSFRGWFILDMYRPLFLWYSEQIGFSHPERAERLEFQLACDQVWGERGLDGFDLDFLTLVGLQEVGAVADVARRFMVREDFLFKVFQRLRKFGWIEVVEKQKFTTFFQTAPAGVAFLEHTLDGAWGEMDRVVVRNGWWQRLRDELLQCFRTAAEVARVVGMPETTVRGYLQGRRQWMHGKWVVALAAAVGWGQDAVSEGVVVAVSKTLAPRYEQCDFLVKDLDVYRQFRLGEVAFDEWLVRRRVEVVRAERLLDAEFAEKLQGASAIRERIIELAQGRGGEIALRELKEDGMLQRLVADRYSAYLADRMAKLIKQGKFVRLAKGRYRLVQQGL